MSKDGYPQPCSRQDLTGAAGYGTAVVILQNSFNWDLRAGHLLLLRTVRPGEAVTNR